MTEPLTDDQIARLRELLTDATRGPWGAEETYPDGTSHCSLAEAACDRAEEATS